MAVNQTKAKVNYGLSQPLINNGPLPIVAKRAPTTADKAEIGTIWVDSPNNDFYVLTSIVSNVATWTLTSNGSGIFASLEATAGDITADVGNIVATQGDVIVTAGDVNVAAGNINVTLGGITAGGAGVFASVEATTGDITADLGNVVVTAGDVNVTAGDVNALAGAGNFASVVANPGPVTVTNGSTQVSRLTNLELQLSNSSSDGTSANAPALEFFEEHTANTISQANDIEGTINFHGFDGVANQLSAQIFGIASGAPAAGYVAGQLIFTTAPDGVASVPLERLRIQDTGEIVIAPPDSGTALTVTGDCDVTGELRALDVLVSGDPGAGIAATTILTNGTNTTQGAGILSILSTTGNPGNNTGFLKIYVGASVAYIPYFLNIAP